MTRARRRLRLLLVVGRSSSWQHRRSKHVNQARTGFFLPQIRPRHYWSHIVPAGHTWQSQVTLKSSREIPIPRHAVLSVDRYTTRRRVRARSPHGELTTRRRRLSMGRNAWRWRRRRRRRQARSSGFLNESSSKAPKREGRGGEATKKRIGPGQIRYRTLTDGHGDGGRDG